MALHRKLSGADVHTPYRWTVADETERMAITTNPDGSTITADNGLRAKLFQIDTNTEYVCTAIDPVFTAVSGGSSSSTAMTAAEIKSAYESNTNTNAYTDADKTKLASVEASATADQTGTEIVSAIDTELGQTAWKTGGASTGGGGFDYTETTDPLITTNPTVADATWINGTRGEIFVCTDNTSGANRWVGQLGNIVQPIFIQTPTAVSPTDGTIGVVETPTLTADAFTCVGGTDTHASSSWQVATDSGFTTVVYESLNDASNLESIIVPAGILLEGAAYYWRVRYTGTIYGDSSYSAVVSFTTAGKFNAVYGLNWDETNDTYVRTGDAEGWSTPADFTNNITVQSKMKRCVLNADGTVNYFLYPTDSTLKADGTTPSVLDGIDGNVMVQIPKFYYKYNYNTASGVVHEHTLSLQPIFGGTVHPAFVQNGVEKDYRYYPAYQGSVVNDKLVSISGAYVDCNLTRASYRAKALNNGAGWHVTDWLLYEAVALLMITEYGTMNMQSALGEGRVRLSGGSWADGSYYGINGNSNSDGNFSNNNTYAGDADDAAADSSYMTYRGCENVWGNVDLFLDGINITDHVVYLNDNPATFADDTTTNYTDIGVTVTAKDGYTVKLANSGKGFFPTDVTGGTDSTGTTDYYHQYAGWRVIIISGSAIDGLKTGLLYMSSAPSTIPYEHCSAGVSF